MFVGISLYLEFGEERTESLNTRINTVLSKSDSREEIENFLSTTNWNYSYDKYSSRYQAYLNDKNIQCLAPNLIGLLLAKCHISIRIQLDEYGRYISSSVQEIFSSL